MLRRSTKIQLALFVLITLLGVSYVSAEYVGLAKYVVGDDGCTVHADFPNSGGIFTNAEVTYRGVTVGKVGSLSLVKRSATFPNGGVRVDLALADCGDPHIPAKAKASIANRSVVGEQYVDIVPEDGVGNSGPFLGSGQTVATGTTPVPTQKLLLDLNDLITSVPLDALRTTVSELDKAVDGKGKDLANLLDATNSLLATANQPANLSATLKLIEDSSSVLQTQLDVQQPLQSWTHSLNLLSQQLKKSDPDIRRLFDNGPRDLTTISQFITNNRTDIGITLSNLITTNNLLVRHIDGLEQVFILYPALASGGQSVLRNREGKLDLILQTTPAPQDCGDPTKGQQGYGGTQRRLPDAVSATAPNVAARCTAPASSGTNVRGSANVPGGDPVSLSGGGYAYPRVATQNVVGLPTKATPKNYSSLQVGPAQTGTTRPSDPRYVSLLAGALQ